MKENVSKQERKMKSVDEIYDTIDEMADLEGSETGAVDQDPSKSSNALLKKITKAKKLKRMEPEGKGLKMLIDESNGVRTNQVDKDRVGKDREEQDRDGETVLHRAVAKLSFKDDTCNEIQVIKLLVENFPELVGEMRPNSTLSGQTPLHMAITKGASNVADILMESLRPDTDVFKVEVSGQIFRNTVMMAELPLSVAALKNDKTLFQNILKRWVFGAKLDARNSKGDNVCHSLIRYAYLYPERLEDVRNMLDYINSSGSLDSVPERKKQIAMTVQKKIWLMKNNEGLIPLQLAAKFGQDQIFKDIMELPSFCCRNDTAGLFDIKVYDATEIDAISFEDPEQEFEKDTDNTENISKRNAEATSSTGNKDSILRRLLELDPKCAFQFIVFAPVRRIIDEKWNAYRCFFYPWFLFHVVYMSFLTWYATERSLQNSTTDGSFEEPDFHYPLLGNAFSLVFGIINILVGTAYIVEECVRLSFRRMPLKRTSVVNPYSNLAFRVFFIVFGLSLIIDFICAASFVWYENYTLMLAVFIGWFLMLFLLRAFRPSSFFTIMIQNVLVGDLLRFAVILICELIAFSTVMFMAMQGASEVDSEYSNYGRVLLSMFKLMVGLGDVGLIYQTRHPALAILILEGFIILNTLLVINSLIAMIPRTSTELVEEAGLASARDIHWKLQRLSLVLYIESVLPRRFVYLGGTKEDKKWYNNRTRHWKSMLRYRLEIRSLQNADNALRSDEADMLNNKWGLDTKFDFTEYLRSLSVDPGRDKVGHYDQKSVAEHEKYPINDEQFSTKGGATWGLQTTRSLGSTIKSHVHVYDHHICDKCETVTDLDKKIVCQ